MPAGQARADAASHVTVDACTPRTRTVGLWAVGRGPWAVATARHWANLPADPNREPVALSPSPARSNRRAPPVVATRARMCAVSPSSRLSIYAPVPSVPPSRGSDSFQCAVAQDENGSALVDPNTNPQYPTNIYWVLGRPNLDLHWVLVFWVNSETSASSVGCHRNHRSANLLLVLHLSPPRRLTFPRSSSTIHIPNIRQM